MTHEAKYRQECSVLFLWEESAFSLETSSLGVGIEGLKKSRREEMKSNEIGIRKFLKSPEAALSTVLTLLDLKWEAPGVHT